jgi:hypothetical protein
MHGVEVCGCAAEQSDALAAAGPFVSQADLRIAALRQGQPTTAVSSSSAVLCFGVCYTLGVRSQQYSHITVTTL